MQHVICQTPLRPFSPKYDMSTYIGPEDQLEEHVEWMRMAVEMVRHPTKFPKPI
jgi:hypothetical protein